MKEIEALVERIRQLTGINNLSVDFNSFYGGYRLVTVKRENGAEYGAFGRSSCCGRISKKEFIQYLSGLIEGIEFNK